MHGREDSLPFITDSDVSGSISPFDREGLGPWLTDPALVSQWDIVVIAKLDRLTRSLRHFDDLRQWCDEHGKTLVSVAESLDLSTAVGRMFVNLLAMFAQFERERASPRRSEAAVKLARDGKLNGGHRAVGHGFRRGPDGRPEARPDEAAVLRRIAGLIMDGLTLTAVCERLTADGVRTRRGRTWSVTAVSRMLTRLGEPYARAGDGTPYYLPEIIPPGDLAAVEAALG